MRTNRQGKTSGSAWNTAQACFFHSLLKPLKMIVSESKRVGQIRTGEERREVTKSWNMENG